MVAKQLKTLPLSEKSMSYIHSSQKTEAMTTYGTSARQIDKIIIFMICKILIEA